MEEIKLYVLKFNSNLIFKIKLLYRPNLFGRIIAIFLFLACRTTNSEFIKHLPHHEFQANQSNLLQPRIEIFTKFQQEPIKKLTFILDTGSNVSLIRNSLYKAVGESNKFKLKSISGEIEGDFGEVKLNLFDSSERIIGENISFHTFEFDSRFAFDGLIGNDVLSKFSLFLELPENVYIIQPNIKTKKFEGFTKIPFHFADGHILVHALIENRLCKLLLDTGAGISYLNQSKAAELNLKRGGKASFIDLRGEEQNTFYHIGENLCVAENLCQKKIELLSGNSIQDFLSKEGNLDGILGMNWVENYSILIDYQNLELYIKKR